MQIETDFSSYPKVTACVFKNFPLIFSIVADSGTWPLFCFVSSQLPVAIIPWN